MKIEWYDSGWKFRTDMHRYDSTTYYIDKTISSDGTRKFRVAIYNGSTRISGWREQTYRVDPVVTNRNPTVTKYSAPTSAKVGESVTVKVRASDPDNNLGTVQINWGDNGTHADFCSKYSGNIYQCTHTYQKSGTYNWAVTAYDNGSPHLTDRVSGSINVTPADTNIDLSSFINYLKKDALLSSMDLSKKDNNLSRADAVLLIDRLLLLNGSAQKDMSEYYDVFPDVPYDAVYEPSLLRLSYYKSAHFGKTAVTKENLFFDPMRWMSRQEFLAVAFNAFDIPKKSADLSNYDTTGMESWATDYVQTAVAYGIIHGSDPATQGGKRKLEPAKEISIFEALVILNNLNEKFPKRKYNVANFETPESIDLEEQVQKRIGYENDPQNYNDDATPIDVKNIQIIVKNKNYMKLRVAYTADAAKGAHPYFWWKTDAGYFKKVTGKDDYSEVYFFPARSKPLSDYHITVNGGDDLGYVDDASLTISKSDTFTYPEDSKTVTQTQIQTNYSVAYDADLLANRAFRIDLSNTKVMKNDIDLGIDQVIVTMQDSEGHSYTLYAEAPNGKKAIFIVPDIPELYGKDVNIIVTVYTQKKMHRFPVKTKTYKPVFKVQGVVYNATADEEVSYVTIGSQKVYLDANNEFIYELPQHTPVPNLKISAPGTEANAFEPVFVDLTYTSPDKYVVLTGVDTRAPEVTDTDNDGYPDETDAFPNDPKEWADNDKDGIGDNADTDDDNDGMPDSFETTYGLNPLDASDRDGDLDGDGVSNYQEFLKGKNPNDPNDAQHTTHRVKNDFNGDGISDIMWRNANTGKYLFYFIDENGERKSYKEGLTISTGWKVAGIGDFNGDGISDIMWRNSHTGKYLFYFIDENGERKSYKEGLTISTGWKVAGIGDFNGDGISDIMWRNSHTGKYLFYFIDENGERKSYKEGLTISTGWKVAGIGDFNGDGISDIMWRNSHTGKYLFYFIDENGARKSYKEGLTISYAWEVF